MKIYRNLQCHKGDTFRELLSMWEESGYCEGVDSEDRFCWVGGISDILLYEYARFDFMPEGWNHALFSNMQMECDSCTPWRLTHCVLCLASCIEEFNMPVVMGDVNYYPYTQEEYLVKVKKSKFGLVLPGYGPKCNREIEYLGLGTVPIYTDGCDISFYNPMEEGVHYLYADSPEKVKDIVSNISESEWVELSENGMKWYNDNCSRRGSFDVTQSIVEGFDA